MTATMNSNFNSKNSNYRQTLRWGSSILMLFTVLLFAMNASAQQVGEIVGKVTGADGLPLEGVSIEAKGDVLPKARTSESRDNGL